MSTRASLCIGLASFVVTALALLPAAIAGTCPFA